MIFASMPWFHALFPAVARASAFVYYRIRYVGEQVPRTGPVLLVANHPNSLLDPMVVVAAARRPVRFLAKAPLFVDPKTKWLVASVGAIPVYRRVDDPRLVERNEDAFRAVYAVLARGDAVGMFPEGLSHSDPSLAPLKTGAARMALGAFALTQATFPIIPIGLDFRQKDVFRSDALAIVGTPVSWDDLGPLGLDDADAVRELTGRITTGLQRVTLNLEQWADRPLVECAVRIWEIEQQVPPDLGARVSRLETTTRLLAAVRRTEDPEGLALAKNVDRFRRRIARLHLRPADLVADVGARRAVAWSASRLLLVAPTAGVTAIAGFLAFAPPYRVTGWLVDRVRLKPDERSTWKLLVGIGVYALWLGIVTGGAVVAVGVALDAVWWGAVAGIAVLLGLPAIGMVGLAVRERWRGTWRDARRFFLLRTRRSLMAQLRADQRALSTRLDALYQRYASQQELR
jgi:glycerol-3-phosphate O-acyltransferase / dihydroxyacetone phosphate acyltransferase